MSARTDLVIDIGIGLAAGAAATAVSGAVGKWLYKAMPDAARKAEKAVSPGSPTTVAADKLAGLAGTELGEGQRNAASQVIHYGFGIAWGPVYSMLRRFSGMTPVGAGAVSGMAMSILIDEALVPALGLSAPDGAYPAATHVRGAITHAVYGAASAVTAELLHRLAERLR